MEKIQKISIILLLILFSIGAKAQTPIDVNAIFTSFVNSSKEYNEDFQKEVKSLISSIENSNIVKKKSFSGGLGMNMNVDFNNQFMVQISCYNTVLVRKTFKKKNELILFLKTMIK